MLTSEFLQKMYGIDDAWDAGFIALWRLDTKTTFWAHKHNYVFANAIAAECARTRDANLYFGMGTQAAEQPHGRGLAAGVLALPGVWVDIDFAGTNRATSRYCSLISGGRTHLPLL